MKTLAVSAISFCLLGFQSVYAQEASSSLPVSPGTFELTYKDGSQRYTLVIPDNYRKETPTPLIVSLHFGGEVTPFYGRGLVDTLIKPAFSELGAIIVAPDRATPNWMNPEAEQQVLELVDYIESHYNIDSGKTLLTGFSLGGMGSWYLAARNPQRFTAAVIVAGRPQNDTASFEWQTPTYVIHSKDDEVLALTPTQSTVDALKEKQAPIELIVIEGVTHYQTADFLPYVKAAVPWVESQWRD